MDDIDISIRKKWLISLICIITLNQIKMIIDIFNSGKTLNIPTWFNYSILVFVIFLTAAYLWIAYRCAYKKPGTKLLTFLIISGPIGILSTIVGLILGKLPSLSQSWESLVIAIFQLAGALWLLFLNWKLRITNKKLQQSSV